MVNHLVKIAEYLKNDNVITFGDVNSNTFINKLPKNYSKEFNVIITEKKQLPQVKMFSNKYASYENRSCQIYITSNNMQQAIDKSNDIYYSLRKQHSIQNIFNINLESPNFIDENEKKEYIYLISLDYKVRS